MPPHAAIYRQIGFFSDGLAISQSPISASVHFLYDYCSKGVALFYGHTVLNSVEVCTVFVPKKMLYWSRYVFMISVCPPGERRSIEDSANYHASPVEAFTRGISR